MLWKKCTPLRLQALAYLDLAVLDPSVLKGFPMQTDPSTKRNIRAICEMEKKALKSRTVSARIGDVIATHAGRMWFIVAHMIWFAIWIPINLKPHGPIAFDPYPFPLLTTIVSLESIFLSLFLLMSQNRSGLLAEQRNHLDLQINLLAEDENTKMLQMLQALCEYHNLTIGHDPEIEVMTRRTEVGDVISDLQKNLPVAE